MIKRIIGFGLVLAGIGAMFVVTIGLNAAVFALLVLAAVVGGLLLIADSL